MSLDGNRDIEKTIDTIATIALTAVFATAVRVYCHGNIMTFVMAWAWAMIMAVIIRKIFEHV